jgi:hypothetical protein
MFRAMKVHHQEVSCTIQALWYNIITKHIYDSMVNHQCVLHLGWSRHTAIIIKVIIEHITVNRNTYIYISINMLSLQYTR